MQSPKYAAYFPALGLCPCSSFCLECPSCFSNCCSNQRLRLLCSRPTPWPFPGGYLRSSLLHCDTGSQVCLPHRLTSWKVGLGHSYLICGTQQWTWYISGIIIFTNIIFIMLNKGGGSLVLPDMKIYYKDVTVKTGRYGHSRPYKNQWYGTCSLETEPRPSRYFIFDKSLLHKSVKKGRILYGKLDCWPTIQKNELDPYLHFASK